jgi:hypothetical protein
VLDRLVPAAMHGLWRMLLLGPAARDAEGRDAEHGWDLVFRGKEIRKDALVKRSEREGGGGKREGEGERGRALEREREREIK